MKKGVYLCIGTFFLFFMGTSNTFGNCLFQEAIHTKIAQLDVANPIGVWKCNIEGASPGYENGILFVRKENGSYSIEVQLSNGTLTGQDVLVEEDSIKFIVNIEGMERVSVVLKVIGDIVLGEAYSAKGSYVVKGARQILTQN